MQTVDMRTRREGRNGGDPVSDVNRCVDRIGSLGAEGVGEKGQGGSWGLQAIQEALSPTSRSGYVLCLGV